MANKNFRVKHGLEVAGSATVENDLTVTGNLTVNGTTTTLNTETLSVEDNIVVLNSGATGTPSLNAGIEVERGDSTNSALTWDETADKWYQNRAGTSTVIPVSTSELAESGNLYYTDERARTALSGGTGVSYDSNTGVIAIGQAVGTTDDVVFATVDANIVDDNYVLGQLYATRNTSYVPPTSPLTTVSGSNGIIVASSSGGNGYGATIAIRHHSGDTTAGINTSSALAQSGASGTSTSPGGVAINQVLGTLNFDGYTAGTNNNYASQIATINQGGGTSSISPIQAQFYARQAFTNSTSVTTAVTGASGTGAVATLTFTTQNTGPYFVGQTVTVAGMTPSGYNGTYVLTAVSTSSISYANATTGFTSGGTIAAANTVTAAGTGFRIRGFANSTNMTVPNRFNFMDLTASAATFKSNSYTFANEVITGSTLTATNYLTLASTGITAGNVDGVINMIRTSGANIGTRPVAFLKNTQTATAAPATNDGASFRFQAQGSNGTAYHLAQFSGVYSSTGDTAFTADIANGDQTGATMITVQPFATRLSGTTIKATASPTATAGGNTLNDIAVFGATSTLLKNATTTATYASIGSSGTTLTTSGRMSIIRTTPGTGILLRQQTTNPDPVNNEEMDFRLSVAGTSTSSDFARFDGTYKSSGDHEIGLSVSTDSFSTDTDKIFVGSRASTKIRATPAGGGTASDIMEISDAKILNNRPHRSAVTTATMARGGTYTPAAGVNNFIELTLTAGTDPTYIDVDNLTVAGEGGHQAILVYNNSGSSIGNGDLRIRNNGTQINDLQSTVASGSRVIFTLYCVGNYASCEYMLAA